MQSQAEPAAGHQSQAEEMSLTAEEMATRLRVSVWTIWRNAEQLGGWKVGRVWRFPVPEARPLVSGRAS